MGWPDAYAQSLSGDAAGAVRSLLQQASATLNQKLLDMSQQILLRQRASIDAAQADALQEEITQLRARCGNASARAILGQESDRRPGGVALRVRTPSPGDPGGAASAPESDYLLPADPSDAAPSVQPD
jgi:hypothetical protein